MRAEQITDPVCYHAEGPVWWPRLGTLRWVDMLAGDVMTMTSAEPQRVHVGASIAAGLRPRTRGGAAVAREHDIAVCDRDDLGDLRAASVFLTDPNIRLNEVGVDPQGRFYAGTMSYDRTRYLGAYYRFGQLGVAPRVAIEKTSTTNGLAWTGDGTRAYFNDTPTGCTDVFDYDPELGLHNRRHFVSFIPEGGRPDGLCVDADGGVWIALNGLHQVRHFDASGHLADVVEVEPKRVTSCCFGGDDYTTLFLTTSREGAEPGEDPLAGSVFALAGAGQGLPTPQVAW